MTINCDLSFDVSDVKCTPLYDTARNKKRLLSEYVESPTLTGFIKIYQDELMGSNSVLNCWNDLSIFFCIETAVGSWLDVIGVIVGIDRVIEGGILIPYFGFETHPSAESFGTVDDITTGGYWRGRGQRTSGPRVMTDSEYRIAIKGKIAKNFYTGTLNDTILAYRAIFDAPVVITDLEDDYTVFIGKELSELSQALILNGHILPKVLGFKLNFDFGKLPLFTFQGVPCGSGFDNGTFIGVL